MGLMVLLGVASSRSATLTVTNSADSGPGTLRHVILDANADASPDVVTIAFNIPGAGVQTIAPLSALPTIMRPVTIDGYTQPGASPNTLAAGDNATLLIQLTGTNAGGGTGLDLAPGSDGSLVCGLVVNGFDTGMALGSSSNVLAGNFIGTDATGRTNLGNFDGLFCQNASFNMVGGPALAARNVISASGRFGIYLYGDCGTNWFQGNFIGTDSAGTNALGNVNGLVFIARSGNVVGGANAGERNVISGNSSYAISVQAPGTVIQGNYIGTDVTGRYAVPNRSGGINLGAGSGSLIGGTAIGAGNLISGNGGDAIGINSPDNIIQGNWIGTDVTGTNALGNLGFGIVGYNSASGNLVGGTTPAARNVVARNAHGIAFSSGTNNVVQGNHVGMDATGMIGMGNTGYGIFLGQFAPGTLIGGTTPGAGNLISGNGYEGISTDSPGTVIKGNILGADVTGTNAIFNGNGYYAVSIGADAPFTVVGGASVAARNVLSGGGGIGADSSSNIFQGNYIGIGADGRTILGTPGVGITVHADGNLVGGDTQGAGNVVSGHAADGIRLIGSNNVVQGNFIGTDATGTLARGNHANGILIYLRPGNLIGGLTSGARNLISGNSIGITASGATAAGNTIQGNFIGTDVTGMNVLANTTQGMSIEDAPANLLGGTTPSARNVISGNGGYALGIAYEGASNNVVQGNYLGVASDGITPLPNVAGVRILFCQGNLIGGTAPGAGNWIANHAARGISVYGDGATNNAFLGNRIFNNGGLGIDLGEDGVTSNDPGDADGSPNHFQNFPEIASAAPLAGDLTVRYRVDSAAANSAYPLTVEFFLADSGGSGKTLIYRHTCDTPQTFTNITFTPAATVNEGDAIVATATDANGNTSEFSALANATANHAPVVLNPIPDQPATYGSAFSYAFPANTFSDPDASDTLSYAASGLPPGIIFGSASRTFSGAPAAAGTFSISLIATDDGTPPISTNDVFNIVVLKAPLIVKADNKRRLPAQANPPLTGTLTGVTNGDNITTSFETTANAGSPPGNYPITPVFSDPDNRLPNYNVITNAGTLTVVDCSTLAITNAVLPGAVAGAAYSVTLKATNGTAPYSFSLTGGAMPSNIMFAADGLLSGTPTNAGSFSFALAATSADGCAVTSNYVLTVVCPAINLSPAVLAAATRDASYTQTITASGGTAPYTFAVSTGVLPDGLSLSSAGTITGTPTAPGNPAFIITATDANGCAGNRSYTLRVVCPLVLNPATLPKAYRSVAYNVSFSVTGGADPYTFTRTSGTLPAGLSLSTGGVLAGIPTTTGNSSFTVQATDSAGCSVVSNYVLVVDTFVYEGFAYATGDINGQNGGVGFSTAWGSAGAFGVQPNSLSFGNSPTSGNHLSGSPGPLSRRLSQSIGVSGTVRYISFFLGWNPFFHNPTVRIGLMLNSSTGSGLFAGVTGSTQGGGWALDNAAGGSQVLSPDAFPLGLHFLVVKCEFLAGNDRFTLYVNPPAGQPEPSTGRVVKFNSDGGTITNIAFTASEAADFDEIRMASSYALVVPSCPAITIDPASLPAGNLGLRYVRTLNASGGTSPYSFSVTTGQLPNGLTLSSDGILSGTPTNGGTFSFTIGAADASGCSGTRNYSITIPCPAITLSPSTLPEGSLGLAYMTALHADGGTNPYSFTVIGGTLPAGLALSSSGSLSGTPSASGTYSFTVNATDAANCFGTTDFSMAVNTNGGFRPTSPLLTARSAHTATLLGNGKVLVAGGIDTSVGYATTSELYEPATGMWTLTAPLHTARYAHTATLLRNGKVLVAGGDSFSSSAELYNPESGTWTTLGPLNSGRYYHTATLLPSGKVLVAGGSGRGGYLSRAELFDPATGTWTLTGSMTRPRDSHAATLLPNGKVLVAGGADGNGSLSSAELYDPATGSWSATSALRTARQLPTATLLPNGRVLVAGGSDSSSNPLASTEVYEPGVGTWTLTGSLFSARNAHSATLLPNGRVLVSGGGNNLAAEQYDPVLGTWTAAGAISKARFQPTATLMPNGRVLIAGGYNSIAAAAVSNVDIYDSSVGTWTGTGALSTTRAALPLTLLPNGTVLAAAGFNGRYLATAELYNPVGETWTMTGPLNIGRFGHRATLLANGNVLITGGYSESPGASSRSEIFDLATGIWTFTGGLTNAMAAHTSTLLPNGKVLVAGGLTTTNGNIYLSNSELYDPATGAWTASGALRTARQGHTATLLSSGKVLVAGGRAQTGVTNSVELYDPLTGNWTLTGTLSTGRASHTATLLPGGKVLIAGGYAETGVTNSAELYDPVTGTWTLVGGLSAARQAHAATLLPNGKVLISGGHVDAGNVLSSAELYDPATRTWSTTGELANTRTSHGAALLPNGKVLVAGGNNADFLSTSELYETGLGFSASWQPQIAALTSPLNYGSSLVLTGSQFRGISEGSGGTSQDSPADYPVVQLRSVENAQTVFLPAMNWSTNSFTSEPVSGFPGGYALATVFVNGIPSTSSILRVGIPAGPSITTPPADQVAECHAGRITAFTVSASGTPPLSYQWRLAGTALPAATNSTLSLTNVSNAQAGGYTVVVTNSFGSVTSVLARLTVVDTTPPALNCSTNITLACAGAAGTPVNFTATALDSCEGDMAVVCDLPSGSNFPLGITTVHCTTSDSSNNTAICSFTVTVVDTTPPALVCSSNLVVECTGPNGAAAAFNVTATDNCDPNVTVTCTPPSGSSFALGTNIVNCAATDHSGNTNLCAFTVTVEDHTPAALTITQIGSQVKVCWPQTCTQYTLQESTDLSSQSNWHTSGATITTEGGAFCANVTATINKFFRLSQ